MDDLAQRGLDDHVRYGLGERREGFTLFSDVLLYRSIVFPRTFRFESTSWHFPYSWLLTISVFSGNPFTGLLFKICYNYVNFN